MRPPAKQSNLNLSVFFFSNIRGGYLLPRMTCLIASIARSTHAKRQLMPMLTKRHLLELTGAMDVSTHGEIICGRAVDCNMPSMGFPLPAEALESTESGLSPYGVTW